LKILHILSSLFILYTYPLFFKSLRLHIAPKQQMSLPQVTTHLSIIAYQSERIGHHSNRRVHWASSSCTVFSKWRGWQAHRERATAIYECWFILIAPRK